MNHPLVSVVIASFNMGQYLPQAIQSILDQTYKNLEVIVIDDGSTDDTESNVSSMLGDTRLRYIKQVNLGQPKAKNNGLAHCQGEFIAFCDGDDLWEKNKLELQIPLFNRPEVGVVYSEVSYIDENNQRYDKQPPYERYQGKITEQLLEKNFVPFGTAIIRKECLDKDGVFNDEYRMGIDWDLWLRYSLNWEFSFCPSKTYIYREWSGQMSNNMKGRYEYAFKILAAFEAKHGSKLSQKSINHSWADMYVSRGVAMARTERHFISPLKDIIKGLSMEPSSIYGWKALIKLFLRKI